MVIQKGDVPRDFLGGTILLDMLPGSLPPSSHLFLPPMQRQRLSVRRVENPVAFTIRTAVAKRYASAPEGFARLNLESSASAICHLAD